MNDNTSEGKESYIVRVKGEELKVSWKMKVGKATIERGSDDDGTLRLQVQKKKFVP